MGAAIHTSKGILPTRNSAPRCGTHGEITVPGRTFDYGPIRRKSANPRSPHHGSRFPPVRRKKGPRSDHVHFLVRPAMSSQALTHVIQALTHVAPSTSTVIPSKAEGSETSIPQPRYVGCASCGRPPGLGTGQPRTPPTPSPPVRANHPSLPPGPAAVKLGSLEGHTAPRVRVGRQRWPRIPGVAEYRRRVQERKYP